MSTLNVKHNLFRLGMTAIMLSFLSACDSTNSNSKSDTDKTIITSCDKPQKMGTFTLSAIQQTQVCNIMVSQLGRRPPVYLLRDLLRLVYLMRETATDETVDAITLQAMRTVQLRQQQNNDEAIQNTLDVVWKIYQSTQTQINFNDLNNVLADKHSKATTISDEELEKIGIALWQKKLSSKHKTLLTQS